MKRLKLVVRGIPIDLYENGDCIVHNEVLVTTAKTLEETQSEIGNLCGEIGRYLVAEGFNDPSNWPL